MMWNGCVLVHYFSVLFNTVVFTIISIYYCSFQYLLVEFIIGVFNYIEDALTVEFGCHVSCCNDNK